MNKYFFIGLLILVLVLVAGLWGYLILKPETFSSFDFGKLTTNTDGPIVIIPDEVPATITDAPDVKLLQLTTRPVAGFHAFETATSSHLFYVERGTGHIFDLDLNSGQEERVSGTTIARVVEAKFSSDGSDVVLVSETDNGLAAQVMSLTNDRATGARPIPLVTNSFDYKLLGNKVIRYGLTTADGTVGYEYDWQNDVTKKLFSSPLKDVRVLWSDSDVYLINKPSPLSKGSIYKVTIDGTHSLIYGPSYGLTAVNPELGADWVIGEIDTANQVSKTYLMRRDGERILKKELAVLLVPEKCTIVAGTSFWCSAPYLPENNTNYLFSWYEGTARVDDYLWKIDLDSGSATLVADLKALAGFSIDANNVTMGSSRIFFTNRYNDNLWSYQLP